MPDQQGNEQQTEEKDAIQELVGSYGLWQCMASFCCMISQLPVAFTLMNYIILMQPHTFWCADGGDQCSSNCTEHVFNQSKHATTVTSEWDLVCENAYLPSFMQSATMLGVIIGSILITWVADKFGRKLPLVISAIALATVSTVSSGMPYYYLFLALRVLCGFFDAALQLVSFVLLVELIGKRRLIVNIILWNLPFTVGWFIMIGLSKLIRHWRYFHLAFSVPMFVLVIYVWWLPESPRWLITVGKKEKARFVLTNACRLNHRDIDGIEAAVDKYAQQMEDAPSSGGKITHLVKTRVMRHKTLICAANWFIAGFTFYGVFLYISHFSDNFFYNNLIIGFVQLPATIGFCLLLDLLGRKRCMIFGNLLASIPLLLLPIFETATDNHLVKSILGALACSGVYGVSITIYCYTTELYPTEIRNFGLGFSSVCSRIGALICPHMRTLSYYTVWWIEPVTFGILPLISIAITLFLPETKKTLLPNSVEEADEIPLHFGI